MLQAEPEQMDLAEARRIMGGGAGLVPTRTDANTVGWLFASVGRRTQGQRRHRPG